MEGEEVRGEEGAKNVGREAPTEKVVPAFRLRFVEIALELVNRRARKKVEHVILLVSGANFDGGELRLRKTRVDDCKCLL